MIVSITGATGQTGSRLTSELLTRGHAVRAIVRDPAKAESLRALGATIVRADLTSPEQLTAALAGSQGVYAMSPPAYFSDDPIGDAKRVADSFGMSVRATAPARLVVLSSIGAQNAKGLIACLASLEEALRDAAPSVTMVRAAWFLENWLGTIPSVLEGTLPSFLAPLDRPFAQIAVEDIARCAADQLEGASAGTHVLELVGPVPLSANAIAGVFAGRLGRDVIAQAIPDSAVIEVVRSFGFSDATARAYREMVAGFNDGTMSIEHPERVLYGSADAATVLGGFLPVLDLR